MSLLTYACTTNSEYICIRKLIVLLNAYRSICVLCERCQRNAPQLKTAAIELQPIAVAPKVWYLVGMNLIGPFKATAQGHQYVLTMTDYFTKFVEAVPIEDKSAISVARGI